MSDGRQTDDNEELDSIIQAYLEACDRGEPPGRDELLAQHPEHRRALKIFLYNEHRASRIFSPNTDEPAFGDDFEVLGEIGHGGMGTVYKAHQKSLSKTVAIKTLRDSPLLTDAGIDILRSEAQRAAGLRHPSIVSVHHVDEHDGHHFFVMDYIEGTNLAHAIEAGPLPSERAARYMRSVASAIHYAHQQLILHRDLKPANILLDHEDLPWVTDFGLALQMEDGRSDTNQMEGTACYMAPEQVSGDHLTTVTDVYGLGAVLYALITGRPPFEADTLQGTLQAVTSGELAAPSQLNGDVDRELEAICMKCLARNPEHRYQSAAALADDLDRMLSGEETNALAWSGSQRVIRWCRRNPAVTGLVSVVVGITVLTVVMALSVAQARKSVQLENALESNHFAARDMAKAALLQLLVLSDTAESAAADPVLARLLQHGDRGSLQIHLQEICAGARSPFESCFLLDTDGVMIARVRPRQDSAEELATGSFRWRDYFRGAMAHRVEVSDAAHISSVYRGRSDDLYKFAISAPILDSNQRPLGVIATSITTDATMALVYLDDPGREVVLIAARDRDEPGVVIDRVLDGREQFVVLFHPAYRHGVPALDFEGYSRITSHLERHHDRELNVSTGAIPSDHSYRDPVSAALTEYDGRWIGGFAPVGHTGFGVIVQQRFESAVGLSSSVFWNLTLWSVAVIFMTIAMILVVFWRSKRR